MVLVKLIVFLCSFQVASSFAPRLALQGMSVPRSGYGSIQRQVCVAAWLVPKASDSVDALHGINTAINWNEPGEVLLGGFFLAYIGFSLFAGLKYVLKDGWRPKL